MIIKLKMILKLKLEKAGSIMRKLSKVIIPLVGVSGTLTLIIINVIRDVLLPKIDETKLEKLSAHLVLVSKLEVFIALLSLVFIVLTPIVLDKSNKVSLQLILALSTLFSIVFVWIGLLQSIIFQRTTNLLLLALFIFIICLSFLVKKMVMIIYEWLQTKEQNSEKFDIAKLTFIWGIIALFLGWLISR